MKEEPLFSQILLEAVSEYRRDYGEAPDAIALGLEECVSLESEFGEGKQISTFLGIPVFVKELPSGIELLVRRGR